MCNGTQGLVREIENFERSGVREIGSKFALLYREKKRDRSFTSRDRELREIGVRAIESHLYLLFANIKTFRFHIESSKIKNYAQHIQTLRTGQHCEKSAI